LSNESPLHILLVEDNPGDVYIIKDLLQSTGTKFAVSYSSRLSDAIKLSGEHDFDVILLDLGLPDSVGLETLKKILVPAIKAPVVVMTGLDDEDIALTAVKEGAQDYLVKNNLTPDGILRAIRYGIERKKIQEIQERHTRQFSILSYTTVAINECEDVPSIYATICNNIKKLLNEVTVFPIDFIDQKVARQSDIEWLEPFFNQIQKMNGLSKNQTLFYLGGYLNKMLKSYRDGKLHELAGATFDTFSGENRLEIFTELKKMLQQNKTYIIGFSRDDKHYGGIFIYSKKEIDSNDKDIIEAISSQASLNIHRRYVENNLKISENRYRILFKEVTTAKEALQKMNEELDIKIQVRTQELAEINTLLYLELDEHKQTSEKLRESEEKYRLLFTKMIDGFALCEIIVDNNGKPNDYKFISVNPAFEQLTGLKAEKIIGKTALKVLSKIEQVWIEIYGEVALSGKSIEFENYHTELNKYFKINAFCPKIGFCAVILEDITQRTLIEMEKKHAEEQLKKYAADLKDLNATKDKFFGIIAHDLKNPFSSLLGASEILTSYVDNLDIDNIKHISLLLNESAKRGYELLENLLEWSRSQTGNINFNPQKQNIADLITDNISNITAYFTDKNIELHSYVDHSIEAELDKDMFNTVLRNLLNNAIKFSRKGSSVSILAIQSDDQITITVKDTGIGIAEKDIDKLFRIDVQYTNIGTAQEKGTGLGLLLCKEFVEKHGGKIWVESVLGKGSEFKFTIPGLNSTAAKIDAKPRVASQI